tara:strand:- start:349 stop:747 length:399 start_codon:yes stop_codon:yes gene_type:complete
MCNERADHDRRRCPAEHKRLFDAQVLKRMSGVQEKSQFLSQATHSASLTCMQTWNSLDPKAKKTGSHSGHAYNWAKKYAVVMSGEQPVLVFKDEAPVGEEAAGGTGNVSLRPHAFHDAHDHRVSRCPPSGTA